MAITITRTPWIDDDGTGTTGTVLNNAVKTDLYNQIDAALAKAAQLAGGNTFTGTQTISGGVLICQTVGAHQFAGSAAGLQQVTIANTLAGTGNGAVLFLNSDVTSQTTLASWSSTYTAAAYNLPNGSTFQASGSNGLSLVASAAAPIRVYTTGLERLRVAPTGELLINTLTNSLAGQVGIASDLGAHQGIDVRNLNAANSGNFITFTNSAGAVAGTIGHITATSVSYVTTSDARLKVDDGPAGDLTALRAVVVHDFRWTADGVRDRGVFAQDVRDLFPRAVLAGTDDRTDGGDLIHPWGTDYSKFVPDLIVGWQQHDAALAELRAILAAVKG